MADPVMANIIWVSFNYAPLKYSLCNGQAIPIAQNTGLFSLLGKRFGGDGRKNFGLPEMRGRLPISMGGGYRIGSQGGFETVTLDVTTLPNHTHRAVASNAAGVDVLPDTGRYLAQPDANLYGPSGSPVALSPVSMTAVGGSKPHNNMQPALAITAVIAMTGDYPSRS